MSFYHRAMKVRDSWNATLFPNAERSGCMSIRSLQTKHGPSFWRTCRKIGFVSILLSPLSLHAQGVEVYTNYSERIGIQSTPTMQDADSMFGARTNIATGDISFSVPVLSIPGNNGLDLTVQYKLGLRDLGGATEWYFEEDEPYVSGSFSEELGWVTTAGGDSRCSNVNVPGYGPPNAPSSSRPGTFYTDEYWSGYYLSTPDGGGRLNRGGSDPNAPTAGGPYKWVTNDLWYFSCIPLASGGTGEGFVGHSPDGLKYFFNTMRDVPWLPVLYKSSPLGLELELERKEIRIYAGKIEDQFGNFITGLSASDGRSVTKSVSGSTTTYTYGTKQWVIQSAWQSFSVTYPDGSVWSANVNGSIQTIPSLKPNCPGDSRNDLRPMATTTATIHSPSGATAVYTLKQVLLGYSYVYGQCLPLDSGGSTTDKQSVVLASALVQRSVSGPGLTAQILNINYGSSNDCYSNANWNPLCNASSPTWRTVTHSHSDGRYQRYTYGNDVRSNADLLLKLEEGTGSNPPLRTTEYEYSLSGIGVFVGSTFPYSVASHKRPTLVTKRTLQGGRSFIWKVPSDCGSGTSLCLDQYGRPTKVVRSSAPSP